jgi:signal transduction histidine kinase
MISQQGQMTTNPDPSPLWFSRRVARRWVIYDVVAGVGYVANVLSTGHLTLARFLLLTTTYGAWLGIIHLGRWLGVVSWLGKRPPGWWMLALVCLACASQFIPLSNTNLNWLPILPTTTACLIVATAPRYVGLIAAGVLWLSSSLAFSLTMHQWDLNSQMTLLVSFISFVGFTVAVRELTLAHLALADSNTELAAAHTQLQEYSAQAEEMAAIRERNRIAREIHDTLGHSLTILAVQLETATQYEARGDPSLHEELQGARRVAKACLTDVRHSVEALRPDDTSSGPLQQRLRRLVAEFAATCRETTVTLDLDEATHPVSPDLTLTLYRCAQEALTNIRKHARATKVLLSLSTRDGPEGQVELTVLDNGQGAASENEERAPGFGLRGMRERVALLRGTVRAGPEPGHGWRVEVEIPLKQREQAGVIARTAWAER